MQRLGRAVVSVLTVLSVSALLLLAPATPQASADPVTSFATHFDGLGSPYGGCGLPQANIDSQDFVALNVYNTPRDYNYYPRPIPADQAARIGLYDNGRNCGRFVEVTIGDYCNGVNDGAQNQPFCRNGTGLVADAYNGAKLTMVVADSCGDSNAWCRDDRYHLDLSKPSLNRFVKNGAPVGNLDQHWNNRQISWQFVPAPNYTGDIRIGFLQGAQVWWGAIAISHLPNGIHGVEYFSNGTWQQARMNSDMGQSYIISGLATASRDFRIRVRDVADQPLFGGRVYNFSLPASCPSSCGPAYTQVPYTVTST